MNFSTWRKSVIARNFDASICSVSSFTCVWRRCCWWLVFGQWSTNDSPSVVHVRNPTSSPTTFFYFECLHSHMTSLSFFLMIVRYHPDKCSTNTSDGIDRKGYFKGMLTSRPQYFWTLHCQMSFGCLSRFCWFYWLLAESIRW